MKKTVVVSYTTIMTPLAKIIQRSLLTNFTELQHILVKQEKRYLSLLLTTSTLY